MNLYNKYRPRKFKDIKDQEYTVSILKKQLEMKTYPSLYMFSGNSGIGKTTTSRVMAMAILCENRGEDFEPCLECESCKLAIVNKHPDIVEVNCPSNNGIDAARQLIENEFRWQPKIGEYKIYIFDEAHMLTKDSQNAFLKTWEENPPYLLTFLCTSEPHKVVPAIRNRSQYFHLKPLSEKSIINIIEEVTINENISYNNKGLSLIANNSFGSARRSLVLLEQISGIGATDENVRGLLGKSPRQFSINLLKCLAECDTAESFNLIETASKEGYPLNTLIEDSCRELYTLISYRIKSVDKDSQDELLADINKLYNGKQIVEAISGLLEILKELRNNVPQDILVQIGIQRVLQKILKLKS